MAQGWLDEINETPKAGPVAAKPQGQRTVLFAVVAALLVLVIFAAALTLVKRTRQQENPEQEIVTQVVELQPFIVNLSEQSSFLKLKMNLECDANFAQAIKEREAVLRDLIIQIVSSKKPADVLSAEGKERLKEELGEAINQSLGREEPAVFNIYFVEFIVQ